MRRGPLVINYSKRDDTRLKTDPTI